MQTAKSQYSYFENLEKTIKMGLALYLTLFLSGLVVELVGLPILAPLFGSPPRVAGLAAAVGGILYGFYQGISKIDWLGELHIRLDRRLFGFLNRSNEIIYSELLASLEPDERPVARSLGPDVRGPLAKSIFSRLANDDKLFGQLLQSGIFRTWIWYWLMIYGTVFFTSLTVLAFAFVILSHGDLTKPLFAANWVLALLHLFACLILGRTLMHMTRKTVRAIVASHAGEIASMLRANIQNVEQPS